MTDNTLRPDPPVEGRAAGVEVEVEVEDAVEATTSLKAATTNGVAWASMSRLAIQVLQFGSTIALARLLTPDDFGLVAIVTTLTGFAFLFADLGLGAAIIHSQEATEDELSSAFWINVLAGFGLTGLFVALAEPIARLYGHPDLRLLIILGSLSFSLSMGVVHSALLQKQMRFRLLGSIELVAVLVYSCAAIGLAAAGAGALSLVLGSIVQTTFFTVALWTAVRWRPRQFLTRRGARALWAYSGHLFGFNVLNYWSRNVDNLLIGKLSTPRELAFYARAYNLMLLPIQQVTVVVGRVLFPALTRLRTDLPRLRTAYLRALRLMVAVSAPLALGLAACAKPFVAVVYGSRWADVAPLLAVLALSAPAQIVAGTTGALYQALGRTRQLLIRGIVGFIITVVAAGVGVHWGAMGVAIAVTIKFYVNVPYVLAGCWSTIGLRLRDGFGVVGRAIACAGLMAATMWGVGAALRTAAPVVTLAAEVAVGLAVYGAALAMVDRGTVRELRGMLPGRIREPNGRHRTRG